ncbi:serine/threonine-protein kinase [Gordonia rubripertincta]|uniref:non-specific serine/threonine protein kinase n=1 Tax=Gordonia rubripertincta TaxID=36822 RepID=A0ABT4MTZ7_GORRU|nr:serine/threonine-protein kinase [Gordonia rubripertincta]MCZ4549506.1 serine/threonine-protein kinase [Gordonia rubripertincta]
MPVPTILAGRYRLRGLLGHGGMGDVYDAWDERLRRPVAVKVLRPEFADKADIRIRFESEASTAATLNHPNVVSVYDSGEDRGVPYIVMERLPGRTLSEEIEAGPLPPDRVRAILSDVLSALAAAHAAGILHRDIKPGNVLFSATGIVKVGDFGIAKTADSAHTTTGEVLGTVAYLSPQRIEGRPATAGDDIYAVGVVGYEAITGRRPFAGDNIASMARNILQQRPEPLAALNPNADAALVHAVERAMAPDPATRFSTAAALRAALQAPPPAPATTPFTAPPPGRPQPPTPATAHPPATGRRSLAIAGVIAAVIAALLVGVIVLVSRDGADSPATPPSDVTTSATTPTTTGQTVLEEPTTRETATVVIPAPTDNGNSNGNGNNGNRNGNGNEKKPKKEDKNEN